MTSADRLARLAAPNSTRRSRRQTTGESRPCPSDPIHGRMLVIGADRDYCAHHDHDGGKGRAQTRCFWPALV
jgi:hypothetical protein